MVGIGWEDNNAVRGREGDGNVADGVIGSEEGVVEHAVAMGGKADAVVDGEGVACMGEGVCVVGVSAVVIDDDGDEVASME